MRFFSVLALLGLVACSSSPAPLKGDIGEIGPVGPQGTKGDKGADGFSAVKVVQTASASCPNGGVQIADADGGIANVCNGATGAQGAQGVAGPTGPQGAVGPVGPTAPSLTLFNADGSQVGQIIIHIENTGPVDTVYSPQAKCVAGVDMQNEKLYGVQGTSIYFTGPNCTGNSFLLRNSVTWYFPTGCAQVLSNFYRAKQPLVMQTMTSGSRYYQNGAATAVCQASWVETGIGVAAEQFTMPTITGPFTFGTP